MNLLEPYFKQVQKGLRGIWSQNNKGRVTTRTILRHTPDFPFPPLSSTSSGSLRLRAWRRTTASRPSRRSWNTCCTWPGSKMRRSASSLRCASLRQRRGGAGHFCSFFFFWVMINLFRLFHSEKFLGFGKRNTVNNQVFTSGICGMFLGHSFKEPCNFNNNKIPNKLSFYRFTAFHFQDFSRIFQKSHSGIRPWNLNHW